MSICAHHLLTQVKSHEEHFITISKLLENLKLSTELRGERQGDHVLVQKRRNTPQVFLNSSKSFQTAA